MLELEKFKVYYYFMLTNNKQWQNTPKKPMII